LAQNRASDLAADELTIEEFNTVEAEILAQYQDNIRGLDGAVPEDLAEFREQRADFDMANRSLAITGITTGNAEVVGKSIDEFFRSPEVTPQEDFKKEKASRS